MSRGPGRGLPYPPGPPAETYPRADGASRLLAHLLDAIIIVIISFFIIMAVVMVLVFTKLDDGSDPSQWFQEEGTGGSSNDLYAFISPAVFILVGLLYLVPQEMKNGQTVGKKAMDIKVLKEDMQPIDPRDAVARNSMRLIWVAPILLPFGYLSRIGFVVLVIEIILLFMDKQQTLADRVAHTRVVSVKPQPFYQSGPYGSGPYQGGPGYPGTHTGGTYPDGPYPDGPHLQGLDPGGPYSEGPLTPASGGNEQPPLGSSPYGAYGAYDTPSTPPPGYRSSPPPRYHSTPTQAGNDQLPDTSYEPSRYVDRDYPPSESETGSPEADGGRTRLRDRIELEDEEQADQVYYDR